jgi:hypothetical protein
LIAESDQRINHSQCNAADYKLRKNFHVTARSSYDLDRHYPVQILATKRITAKSYFLDLSAFSRSAIPLSES